jgi:hypothetical protein
MKDGLFRRMQEQSYEGNSVVLSEQYSLTVDIFVARAVTQSSNIYLIMIGEMFYCQNVPLLYICILLCSCHEAFITHSLTHSFTHIHSQTTSPHSSSTFRSDFHLLTLAYLQHPFASFDSPKCPN